MIGGGWFDHGPERKGPVPPWVYISLGAIAGGIIGWTYIVERYFAGAPQETKAMIAGASAIVGAVILLVVGAKIEGQ